MEEILCMQIELLSWMRLSISLHFVLGSRSCIESHSRCFLIIHFKVENSIIYSTIDFKMPDVSLRRFFPVTSFDFCKRFGNSTDKCWIDFRCSISDTNSGALPHSRHIVSSKCDRRVFPIRPNFIISTEAMWNVESNISGVNGYDSEWNRLINFGKSHRSWLTNANLSQFIDLRNSGEVSNPSFNYFARPRTACHLSSPYVRKSACAMWHLQSLGNRCSQRRKAHNSSRKQWKGLKE